MSNPHIQTEAEKLRFFIEKNGYSELLTPYAIDELIRFIEIDLLLPLKADLMKRQTVMNNLKRLLENYI